MKFRARMIEPIAMKRLYNILQSMTKLTKSCVLRLASNTVFFISSEPVGSSGHLPTGGPSIWCQLEQESFFNDYKLEGVTPENPEIYLELEPGKLLKAMSLVKSMKTLKIKLTRKHDQACLSLDIDLTPTTVAVVDNNSVAANVHGRHCVHDVPVNVVPRRNWSSYGEPVMRDPDISIYLPELKKLKHLVERYKNLAHFVVVQAQPNGKLIFKLESDTATVATHYPNLEVVAVKKTACDDTMVLDGDDADANTTSVKVDLRLLSLFLGADHITPKRVLANLVNKKMLYLFLLQDGVFIQFCLPSILD